MSTGVLIPYLRQSRKKERSISIEEQKRGIEAWAKREGVKLAPALVEEGVSGNKHWRERELGRAVKACEAGKAGGIIVAWQDRLSRENGLATAEVWESLDRAGARLVVSEEGLDTAKGDHELVFTIKAAIARDQWKRHQANWLNARRNAVARGMHLAACPPFGYRDAADGTLEPDPKTERAARDMFLLRAGGMSWSEVRRELERKWGISKAGASYQRMIKNRVYLGEARSGEFVKENAHEPLVTRAEWLAAQSKQPGRVSRNSDGTRLAGIVVCATCGERMTPERPRIDEHGREQGGRYKCRPNIRADRKCDKRAGATLTHLDAYVIDAFLEHWEKKVAGFIVSQKEREAKTEPLRKGLDAAKDALQKWIDDPLALAALSPENRTEVLKNTQAEVDAAQDALDKAETKQFGNLEEIVHLSEFFDTEAIAGFGGTTIPEQRRMLTAGIERVTVKPGREPLDKRVTIAFRDAA